MNSRMNEYYNAWTVQWIYLKYSNEWIVQYECMYERQRKIQHQNAFQYVSW
jgi:hypothetical protein